MSNLDRSARTLQLLEAIRDENLRRIDELLDLTSTPATSIDWLSTQGTALHISAVLAKSSVAEYLIKRGANVNSVDDEGNTALHKAARAGAANVVKVLLAVPTIDPTIPNRVGETPLEVASEKRTRQLIESL